MAISYDEVNRTETYLAEIGSRNNENERFIPSNINPSSFVTFAADNGDHNPESLYGKSLHCTNMIMIQPQEPNHISINKEPTTISDLTYQRKRSFKPINMDIRKYQPVKRTTPGEIKSVEREQDLLIEQFSKKQDLIWIPARMNSFENTTVQTVPAWTGFNYLISPDDPNCCPDKGVYLPSINKYPTEMATVNEVLHLVNAKPDALQLTEVDLVLDHAIYFKALEIISNPVNSGLKNAVNLRMGGFHAECIFMSVISKTFLDGGLKDLEARNIRGRKYNITIILTTLQ